MEDSADLTPARLRQFGLILGALTATLFGLLPPLAFGKAWPAWPWIVASVLALLALGAPRLLHPVYRVWMRIGGVLGWINTRVLLLAIFGLLVVPFGIIMRVFGRDPMKRRIDPSLKTYRTASRNNDPRHMKDPY